MVLFRSLRISRFYTALSGLLVFTLVFASSPANAQTDDDIIAPLTTPKPKSKPKKKPKAVQKPSRVIAPDDLLAPLTPIHKAAHQPAQLLVKLSSGLKGAKLLIDGREIGNLPVPTQQVAAGDHAIVVKRSGYADFSKKINTTAGKLTEVVATLEPIAASVSVTSNFDGALVYVNDELVGSAPQNELWLPTGIHKVVLRKDGFQDDIHNITVRAGKEYVVKGKLTSSTKSVAVAKSVATVDRPEKVDLTPITTSQSEAPIGTSKTVQQAEPFYKQWYVWVGAAVVVTAATVGIVAVTSKQPDTPGANDPCYGGVCNACIPASKCAVP